MDVPAPSLAPVRRGISDLPDEVIIKIFHQSYGFCKGWWDDVDTEVPWIHDLRILSLVCKDWRAIILNTPSFWTTINCCWTNFQDRWMVPEVISARLSHTGTDASLKFLRKDLVNIAVGAESMYIILAQLHRLEELKTSVRMPCALNEKLRGRAPLLKVLDLGYDFGPDKPLEVFDLDDPQLLGGAPPPKLTTLSLEAIRVPWHSCLLTTTLTLLELHNQTPFASYRDLYNTLSPLTNLEVLRLWSALPPPSTSLEPELVLPRLRTLWLQDDLVRSMAGVLQFLKFQPSVASFFPQPSALDDHLALIRESIRCIPPSLVFSSPSSTSPLDEFVPSLILTGASREGSFCCHYQTTPKGWREYPLFMASFRVTPGTTTLDVSMEKAVKAFPLKKVESFVVEDYSPTNPQHFWMETVGPLLKHLKVIEMAVNTGTAFLETYSKYLDVFPTIPSDERLFTSLQTIRCKTSRNSAASVSLTAETRVETTLIFNVNEKRQSLGLSPLVLCT
ncbi:hypothetical protein ONZ45_g3875 [Pleurotus djamor]|nr:hypothetical protein ONZ45_g3875 [Pleurotus djamor]